MADSFPCRQTNKRKKPNSGLEFSELLLLNLDLKAWSDAPFVLTFVHAEYLILKHFGDRGRMKCYKADITGDSIFQDAHRTHNLHSNQHSNSWEMCLLCSRFIILLCTNNSPTSPSKSQEKTGEKKKKHFLSLKTRITTLCLSHLPQLSTHLNMH